MESTVFDNTHLALKAILDVTPLASRQAVLQYAKECLPYAMTTDSRGHTKYLENLMRLTEYLKPDRRTLLKIVIGRLVELDAHLPHQVRRFCLDCTRFNRPFFAPNQDYISMTYLD